MFLISYATVEHPISLVISFSTSSIVLSINLFVAKRIHLVHIAKQFWKTYFHNSDVKNSFVSFEFDKYHNVVFI